MAARPKLIISDVDGTLIDHSEVMATDFKRLARMIKEHNIPFTLASGRCYSELKPFISSLNIDLPIIANNGAGAYRREETLWGYHMNSLHVRAAIEYADKLDMVIIMGNGIVERAYRHNAYIQNQIDRFKRYNHFHIPLEEEWEQLNLQKLLIIDPQQNGRIQQIIDLLEPYRDQLHIVQYDDRSIDIMPQHCNKSTGMIALADKLNINVSDIMTIGDAKNDLEMIKLAGIGVAVGNAVEELKVQANYICQHGYVLGVIEALEKFYVNRNECE